MEEAERQPDAARRDGCRRARAVVGCDPARGCEVRGGRAVRLDDVIGTADRIGRGRQREKPPDARVGGVDEMRLRRVTACIAEAAGNLRADGAVKSTIFVNDVDEVTKKPTSTASTATAASMQYDDTARRMSYETTAHLVSPQGDITGANIGLTFAKDTQDVKTLDAAGAVTLKEHGRVTTGDKLVYVAEGEIYTMSGKLVKMIEANCRQNTGTKLTFDKSADNLRIEGNDDSRTQSSKSAPGCIPRPD